MLGGSGLLFADSAGWSWRRFQLPMRTSSVVVKYQPWCFPETGGLSFCLVLQLIMRLAVLRSALST